MTTPEQEAEHWGSQAIDQGVWAVEPSRWLRTTRACAVKIATHLAGCDRILEIGCGVGRLTGRVASRLPRSTIVGSDVSPAMLEEAADRGHPPNVEWQLTDGRALPVGPWDGIYTMVCLQHLPLHVQRAYIEQAGQHLRSGGRLLAQVVEGVEDSDWNHHTTRAQVARWCLRAGLDARITGDTEFPTWLWIEAEKPKGQSG